ncbi:7tm 7 domain containing protein [Asbolus verrucosus]|uniref:7tm 7 domain containing protein n=1 Tax=Asbolus verrucosus TaxID=1661398 RepID=A0A482WAK3_ASBVE|nr:7tm 7 domain containing protein [Asbolus verrucosus]
MSVLNETVKVFNDIFGWIILFIIIGSGMRNLNYMDFLIKGGALLQDFRIVVYEVWAIIQSWVGLLAIILLCDATLKEHEAILALVSKLELSTDLASAEHDELETFVDVVERNGPKFRAANFFSIDKSILLSFLNTIVTFFLIIIQYKSP